MGTPCTIGRRNADTTITHIRCSYDGYPEGAGAKLLRAYADPAKVDALIALGDLVELYDEIAPPTPYSWPNGGALSVTVGSGGVSTTGDWSGFFAEHGSACIAQIRDYGGSPTEFAAKTASNMQEFACEEWNYLFEDGIWKIVDVNGTAVALHVDPPTPPA